MNNYSTSQNFVTLRRESERNRGLFLPYSTKSEEERGGGERGLKRAQEG